MTQPAQKWYQPTKDECDAEFVVGLSHECPGCGGSLAWNQGEHAPYWTCSTCRKLTLIPIKCRLCEKCGGEMNASDNLSAMADILPANEAQARCFDCRGTLQPDGPGRFVCGTCGSRARLNSDGTIVPLPDIISALRRRIARRKRVAK